VRQFRKKTKQKTKLETIENLEREKKKRRREEEEEEEERKRVSVI